MKQPEKLQLLSSSHIMQGKIRMEKGIGAFNEDVSNCRTAEKNVLQWCPPELGYLSGLQMHLLMLASLGSGLSQHGRPGILPQLRAITGDVILVE